MSYHDTADQLIDRARRLFGDVECKRQVAALPWRTVADGVEVMLITSRDTGRWVLPKGNLDKGEKPWRGAEREAMEEAGVSGTISHQDVGRYYYAKVRLIGRAIPCEVLVFPLATSDVADKWDESSERKRRWMKPALAADMVDEPDLAALLRDFTPIAA